MDSGLSGLAVETQHATIPCTTHARPSRLVLAHSPWRSNGESLLFRSVVSSLSQWSVGGMASVLDGWGGGKREGERYDKK